VSKIYRIDMMVAATAYIRANSEDEALQLARAMRDDTLEVADAGSEVPISGARFDDPDLPDVSLSPAMTVRGPFKSERPELAE
jgi:hypothetical protein